MGKASEKAPDAGKPGFRRWWRARSPRARWGIGLLSSLGLLLVLGVYWSIPMPGQSWRGPLPELDDEQRRLVALLRRNVERLASDVGERHMRRAGTLERAWNKLEAEFEEAGYDPKAYRYQVDGKQVANLEAVLEGSSREVVVVGAHYDSAVGAPGADDNASGVAVLLEIARAFENKGRRRTIRFVAFVNEEPPHFQTESMGSLHYARACKERGDEIVAMLSLESLGYYRDEPGSQKYPPIVSWFYPDQGNFVAFIGNASSRSLVHESIASFREAARFPSEGVVLPSFVKGVGWSDQWSFWQTGYPGVMITDTAPFRNPNYHTANDKPETLDYERLARVTAGLIAVVGRLSQ